MRTEIYPLAPPSLEELAEVLKAPLAANYERSNVAVVQCPNLQEAPFYLASQGLSGNEKIADVGGQPNLFPRPLLDTKWNMKDIATAMGMDSSRGSLIGAGAGPYHQIGQNCELVPNFSWQDSLEKANNQTRFVEISPQSKAARVRKSPSLDCALMVNLYGSSGETGPVLKITAKRRKGHEKSFTGCIQKALHAQYGNSQTISLGGAFLVKSGKARYHVMPDFPSDKEMPFKNREEVDQWLTYHDFEGPMLCLSVMHSADPENRLGLRIEHTHSYSPLGEDAGGHYHYDIEESEEPIEYEGYFNTAKVLYRIERPM